MSERVLNRYECRVCSHEFAIEQPSDEEKVCECPQCRIFTANCVGSEDVAK